MKGDKFHYAQNLGEMTISETTKPVKSLASTRDEEKKDAKEVKKEEKKDEKKDAKKEEKKDEKKDEKKVAKDGEEKKDEKKEGDEKKDEKKDGKDDEKKEGDEEEKKEEEKKAQAPGEATWEEHNDCKENEWEAGDGNCAFEAENLKIGRNSLLQVGGPQGIAKDDADQFSVKYPVKFSGEGYPATEKVHTLSPEVHMEVNNQASTYLFPRTAFYVETGEGEGIWMNGDNDGQDTGVESVRGPAAGAPIGVAVHAISNKAGEPYANTHVAPEPKRNV